MDDTFAAEYHEYEQQLLQLPAQLEYGQTLIPKIEKEKPIDKIVFVGMGGSGFIGDFCQALCQDLTDIPIIVLKDSHAHSYITENSLVFILSYSGNTQETIEVYRRVMQRKAVVFSFSSGGKIEQLSHMYDNTYIKIPSGLQPRQSIGYFLPSILSILSTYTEIPSFEADLHVTIQSVKKNIFQEYAKDLYEKIQDTTPIMYGARTFAPLAYVWKTQLQETAKQPAFSHVMPECFHNELMMLDSQTAKEQFSYLILHDSGQNDKTLTKKISSFYSLLKEKKCVCQEIKIRGENSLSRMISAYYLGEWFALICAQKRLQNPLSVKTIEDFKQKTK
ncbi:MAG: SIS domain-containing protein [Candidatus Woesearchaeota archaeon]